MKILIGVAGFFVTVACLVYLAGQVEDYRNRPSDLERSMEELDKAMERYHAAQQRAGY